MLDKSNGIAVDCGNYVEAMNKLENVNELRHNQDDYMKKVHTKLNKRVMAEKYIALYRSIFS